MYKLKNPYYKISELLKKINDTVKKNELLILYNLINDNTPINQYAGLIITNYDSAKHVFKELLIKWINTVDQDIKYYTNKFDITELLDLKQLLLNLSSRYN